MGRRLPLFIDTNLAAAYVHRHLYGERRASQRPKLYSASVHGTERHSLRRDHSNFGYWNVYVQWGGFRFNRRMSHGLQVQASYTYSHASDDGQSSTTFTATNNVVNPYAMYLEQGRSIFDIRQRVVGSAIWQPQYFHNRSSLERLLLDGFSFSPVVSAASGAPYSGFVSGTAPSCTASVSTSCIPTGTFPAGVPACIGCTNIIGDGGSQRLPFVPRDTFLMPNTVEVDLRVGKKFWYKERASFELTADVFNILNRVNPTEISGALVNSTSSQYVDQRHHPDVPAHVRQRHQLQQHAGGAGQRQIQIGARLNW